MTDSESGPVELGTLQGDQEVYSSDSEPLGQVAEITEDMDSGEPYLVVGGDFGDFHTLYIPRSAIVYAVLGKPVRVSVTRDEAISRFTTRPNVM